AQQQGSFTTEDGGRFVRKQLNAPNAPAQESLRFPALSFSQGMILAIDSLDRINQCTRLGFKSGFYKKLLLVDSDSRKFQVVDARKVRTILNFGLKSGGLIDLLGGNPRYQIELIFSPASKVPLAEVKELIADSFKKQRYSWEEMTDLDEFREKIARAESLSDIFLIFKEFNQI